MTQRSLPYTNYFLNTLLCSLSFKLEFSSCRLLSLTILMLSTSLSNFSYLNDEMKETPIYRLSIQYEVIRVYKVAHLGVATHLCMHTVSPCISAHVSCCMFAMCHCACVPNCHHACVSMCLSVCSASVIMHVCHVSQLVHHMSSLVCTMSS